MSWACAVPDDLGATWNMDERDWNVGHTNERGEKIANIMGGSSIQHTYETSSYNKPENGPGPGLATRQPAYQVTLSTQWALTANFQKKVKVKHEGCWGQPDGQSPITPCYTTWECANDKAGTSECLGTIYREYTSLDWVDAESYIVNPVTVYGATVPQDTVSPGGCNAPIPIAVIQSQTVLGP
jgi:hypothetical protein